MNKTDLLRANESRTISVAAALFVYLAARMLSGEIGISAYALLSFAMSALFFSVINCRYGFLPRYELAPAPDNWKTVLRYGYRRCGETPFGYSAKARKRCYGFIVAALVLTDLSVIAGIIPNKYSSLAGITDVITVCLFCMAIFLFLGLPARGNFANFQHWLKHEVFWIRCVYACALFFALAAQIFLTAESDDVYINAVIALVIMYAWSRLAYSLLAYR